MLKMIFSRRFVLALVVGALSMRPSTSHADNPCEPTSDPQKIGDLINKYGGDEFRNPVSVTPTSEASRHDIVVHYAVNSIAGCDVRLRSYNGKIVGETIHAKPGDTLYLRLVNALPPADDPNLKHPQKPAPAGHEQHFSFNVTNLHTHGLNTAPQGPKNSDGKVPFESDNVLVTLQPGEQQEYRIHIHDQHPAGTFWYHAHVHGSTAVQLASGMAGALIIEEGTAQNGDLNVLPEVKQANEKIFVLQQFGYDKTGKIETFSLRNHPTLINGQLAPKIRMRPGEVQRWRFIHAGIQENIVLALDGHPLHEVAADGISLGRRVHWPESAATVPAESRLVLGPGYRTDVLVKAVQPAPGQRVFLRDLPLNSARSLRAADLRNFRAAEGLLGLESGIPVGSSDKPEQILAEIIIEGPPMPMDLPAANALANVTPAELKPISDDMLQAKEAQSAEFRVKNQLVCQSDGSCQPCVAGDDECKTRRYLIDNKQFSDGNGRPPLKLNAIAEWTLAGIGATGEPEPHPFHIHVNPFYYQRPEPGAAGGKNWVWKDTLLIGFFGNPEKVRMKYNRFTGTFVLHCHILTHEDQGMMQLVEIIP
jgi:FtsP/CotA-like multicopper oxidase with cupredoxin domain